jgi:hypothetical protein
MAIKIKIEIHWNLPDFFSKYSKNKQNKKFIMITEHLINFPKNLKSLINIFINIKTNK